MSTPSIPHRINLRRIAAEAGCHYSTVSLALRNHPRIPQATCEKIQELARRLGYVPDPMVSSLAYYRNTLRAVGYQATFAWLTNHSSQRGWRQTPLFQAYFNGAAARAASLGYKLEEFWLREPGMTPARATQILRARRITGLLIAPQPAPGTELVIDWSQFSALCIGWSLVSPRIHLVCPHQYRALRLVMQELKPRGYRRPGLVMLRASDERVDRNWTAGFLVEQQALPVHDRVAPLLMEAWDEQEFTAWLLQERPDVVVTKFVEVQALVLRLGFQVPRDLGTVFLTCTEPGSELSGVYENPDEVGAAAVDYLTSMTHRNERGVPRVAQRILIESSWIDGATVRPALRVAATTAI